MSGGGGAGNGLFFNPQLGQLTSQPHQHHNQSVQQQYITTNSTSSNNRKRNQHSSDNSLPPQYGLTLSIPRADSSGNTVHNQQSAAQNVSAVKGSGSGGGDDTVSPRVLVANILSSLQLHTSPVFKGQKQQQQQQQQQQPQNQHQYTTSQGVKEVEREVVEEEEEKCCTTGRSLDLNSPYSLDGESTLSMGSLNQL